jgi:hypothetical protein
MFKDLLKELKKKDNQLLTIPEGNEGESTHDNSFQGDDLSNVSTYQQDDFTEVCDGVWGVPNFFTGHDIQESAISMVKL